MNNIYYDLYKKNMNEIEEKQLTANVLFDKHLEEVRKYVRGLSFFGQPKNFLDYRNDKEHIEKLLKHILQVDVEYVTIEEYGMVTYNYEILFNYNGSSYAIKLPTDRIDKENFEYATISIKLYELEDTGTHSRKYYTVLETYNVGDLSKFAYKAAEHNLSKNNIAYL